MSKSGETRGLAISKTVKEKNLIKNVKIIKLKFNYHQLLRHREDVLFWNALDGQSAEFKKVNE